MVPPRTTSQLPAGVTPAKIGVVAVLSLLFVAVVVYQVTSNRRESPLIRQALERRGAAREDRDETDAGPDKSTVPALAAQRPTVHKWQAIPLDEALAHDPFLLPVGLRPDPNRDPTAELASGSDAAAARARRQELEQRREAAVNVLREQGVGMVMTTARGTVAVIGSRQLQVGDEVDGLRVVEIGPAGVVLVEINEP
jgi:hypothetical protein